MGQDRGYLIRHLVGEPAGPFFHLGRAALGHTAVDLDASVKDRDEDRINQDCCETDQENQGDVDWQFWADVAHREER